MFNIIEKTGFALSKFSDEEKDCKAMISDKARWALLQKIFDITGEALGVSVDLLPKNVTKRKDCAKTRQFLQHFCAAAAGRNVLGDVFPSLVYIPVFPVYLSSPVLIDGSAAGWLSDSLNNTAHAS